jgi:hypothetical protein
MYYVRCRAYVFFRFEFRDSKCAGSMNGEELPPKIEYVEYVQVSTSGVSSVYRRRHFGWAVLATQIDYHS